MTSFDEQPHTNYAADLAAHYANVRQRIYGQWQPPACVMSLLAANHDVVMDVGPIPVHPVSDLINAAAAYFGLAREDIIRPDRSKHGVYRRWVIIWAAHRWEIYSGVIGKHLQREDSSIRYSIQHCPVTSAAFMMDVELITYMATVAMIARKVRMLRMVI